MVLKGTNFLFANLKYSDPLSVVMKCSLFRFSRLVENGSSGARVSFSSTAFPPAFDAQSQERAVAWQEAHGRSSNLSIPGPDVCGPLKLTPELP